MPVVVMQGSGVTTVSATNQGPESHMCLAIFVLLLVNPPFGIVALGFAIASRLAAPLDWDGARMKGKISMFISITGIVITIIVGLALVLIFFTKDS